MRFEIYRLSDMSSSATLSPALTFALSVGSCLYHFSDCLEH
nr:MAG TPA: hypothetical protein [Caudoviricetes sp.]